MPSPATAISLLALFVALGGTGYAVIKSSTVPDKTGVFHGCVNKSSGALRVIEKAGSCKKKTKKHAAELEIKWSQKGPAGAAGTNGLSIVGRLRSTGELTTNNTKQAYALTPSSWPQEADEADQFLAIVTYHAPASADCTSSAPFSPGVPGFPGNLTVDVKVDGVLVTSFAGFAGGTDRTVEMAIPPKLETGTAGTRSMTLEASDNCGTNGGTGNDHYKIQSVSVDVLAAR